jgi:hypothetical protein
MPRENPKIGIYYRDSSRLKKKMGPQSIEVRTEGFWFPDSDRRISRIDTATSVLYEIEEGVHDAVRSALKGKQRRQISDHSGKCWGMERQTE